MAYWYYDESFDHCEYITDIILLWVEILNARDWAVYQIIFVFDLGISRIWVEEKYLKMPKQSQFYLEQPFLS